MSENNSLRCPECGYTQADAELHGDHHLCSGEIPLSILCGVKPLEPGQMAGLRQPLATGEVKEGQKGAGTEFSLDLCVGGSALWWQIRRPDEDEIRTYSIPTRKLLQSLIEATIDREDGKLTPKKD